LVGLVYFVTHLSSLKPVCAVSTSFSRSQ
jgi:hypothetical protein